MAFYLLALPVIVISSVVLAEPSSVETGAQTVDPLKIDKVGFEADVMAIQSLVRAVVSNAPNPVDAPVISEQGMMVMTLLLLTAGTEVFRRRSAATSLVGQAASLTNNRV